MGDDATKATGLSEMNRRVLLTGTVATLAVAALPLKGDNPILVQWGCAGLGKNSIQKEMYLDILEMMRQLEENGIPKP